MKLLRVLWPLLIAPVMTVVSLTLQTYLPAHAQGGDRAIQSAVSHYAEANANVDMTRVAMLHAYAQRQPADRLLLFARDYEKAKLEMESAEFELRKAAGEP